MIKKYCFKKSFLVGLTGSRAEETMTPTYAGRQVTYQPDNDYMYIIEDSCINESIYTESTKTPGFVSVKFENNKNNHEVIDSGLKSTENGFILSPLTFKMVVRTRIEIVQELLKCLTWTLHLEMAIAFDQKL